MFACFPAVDTEGRKLKGGIQRSTEPGLGTFLIGNFPLYTEAGEGESGVGVQENSSSVTNLR